MRRADLHPDLRTLLREVEADIDTRTIAALTKYGHTPTSARAYLARRDIEPLRRTMQLTIDGARETWSAIRDTFAWVWDKLTSALAPLTALAETPDYVATCEAHGWLTREEVHHDPAL